MKQRALVITSFICLTFLLTPSFLWGATGTPVMNPRKIRDLYGFYIARFYETVSGLPLFDVESKDKFKIAYRRDEKPCSEIFLRENPDMAEDCKKLKEELTFVNKYGNLVRVLIKDGKIVSTTINTSFDEKNPIKDRAVIILHGALIVHDLVMDRYSRNLAKIYHFPGVQPSVEFDRNHNVLLRVGNRDLIRFDAKDFRQAESQGFKLTSKPKLIRNGTRALPDISYLGSLPHMVAVNWSYPPLTGHFTLDKGSKRMGKVPTTLLYKPLKKGRAQPLFEGEGLVNYLKGKYEDGTLKRRYGIAVHKFVEMLIETQGSQKL